MTARIDRQVFAAIPRAAQVWAVAAVVAALVLPFVLSRTPVTEVLSGPSFVAHLLLALALIAGSIVNTELGRFFEGRRRIGEQRPHKGLSAWPMAAAVLLAPFWLLPVVVAVYAYARWRGVRVTLWKWVVSGSSVISAGAVAGSVLRAGDGVPPGLTSGWSGLGVVIAAAAVYLMVETLVLAGSAILNAGPDDAWMRATLADPVFYLIEFGVVLFGALTGLLAAGASVFVFLLLPGYAYLQLSVLHRPLQDQAARDPKTGLLHALSWQVQATAVLVRVHAARAPWAVLFADLDHFKEFNEIHGHLGGDEALARVADALRLRMRPGDLVARFGGEEFCVLLPATAPQDALTIAERLRAAVEAVNLPGASAPLTISIGLVTVDGDDVSVPIAHALELADRALFQAKLEGRNVVRHSGAMTDERRPLRPTTDR